MSDKLGTVIGLLIGATLVIFGIIWPDHLSNYYLYQLREFEMTLESLKQNSAPIEQIRAHQAGFQAFQDSWFGSISRFADLKSLLIVLGVPMLRLWWPSALETRFVLSSSSATYLCGPNKMRIFWKSTIRF